MLVPPPRVSYNTYPSPPTSTPHPLHLTHLVVGAPLAQSQQVHATCCIGSTPIFFVRVSYWVLGPGPFSPTEVLDLIGFFFPLLFFPLLPDEDFY